MRTIIEQYSKDLTSGRLAYAYDHFSRVYFYAKKISDKYDDAILHAACFMYKIILGTQSKEDSALRAEAILSEAGFHVEKVALVKEAILNSDIADRPKTQEGKLLHDAIIIDNLGAVGFSRFSISSFFWDRSQKISEIYQYYKDYVSQVKNNILVEETYKYVENRLEFSQNILKQLYDELEEK